MVTNTLKSLAKRVIAPFRTRLRPSVLIVGVQKAGTSALFDMLAAHDEVLAPDQKELDFFSNDKAYASGLRDYFSMFPLAPLRGPRPITLEATPEYVFKPTALQRIAKDLPRVRIIVLLRDPVERAYSAWNMYRSFATHPRYGHLHDARTFEQAMEEELRNAPTKHAYHYLKRGVYADQLEVLFSLFPKEQVLILDHSEFLTAPARVFERACRFIGITPVRDPAIIGQRSNVRPYTSSMDPDTAARLTQFFEPHQQRLRKVLEEHGHIDKGANAP